MGEQVTPEPGIELEFLAGGGAMGERIRGYPWAHNPLGQPQFWPRGLRTAVRILLTTQHPMFIFWGREHTCIYNDAYCRSLGPESTPPSWAPRVASLGRRSGRSSARRSNR